VFSWPFLRRFCHHGKCKERQTGQERNLSAYLGDGDSESSARLAKHLVQNEYKYTTDLENLATRTARPLWRLPSLMTGRGIHVKILSEVGLLNVFHGPANFGWPENTDRE
jgi:hypothetical protein